MKWGDQSECLLLYSEGEPVGNFFIARKGKHIVTFLMTGIYFDDAESFRDLMMPVLDRIDRYKP